MRPAVVCLVLMTLPGNAQAFELWGMGPLANASVQITADTKIRYHRTDTQNPGRIVDGPYVMFPNLPVNDYLEQVGRYNVQLTKESLSIGLQFDEVALFSNRYVLDLSLIHI